MLIIFISSFCGSLLFYYSSGKEFPSGVTGLTSIIVLVFLIYGIKKFLEDIVIKIGGKNDRGQK
ncbi:hypothetical protein L3Q72_03025 [Vibrio sp. JC009]|uniref:hypothetical protein n=1 Tax=Vibrio sp. JC009 TaxID=2912314 RepID=UPI0023AEFBDC|nr:hypothetical protein [Vibrio sp. JC009]WED22392.1 hypothetical protein L3Q72_03025 [Vibrio sp. JC009]